MDLSQLRSEYENTGISESEFDSDPMPQFGAWLQEAMEAELVEPNAMVLSTVDPMGQPAARYVLCKGISSGEGGRLGLEFYTNYNSDKGLHLKDNPKAAVTFGWLGLNRQVRMQGKISKTTAADSESYFFKRPLGAQLGAMASAQSEVIANRSVLEDAVAALEGTEPKRPEHWGGYRIVPDLVEFWQGRTSRLHDRLRYRFVDEDWVLERLSP